MRHSTGPFNNRARRTKAKGTTTTAQPGEVSRFLVVLPIPSARQRRSPLRQSRTPTLLPASDRTRAGECTPRHTTAMLERTSPQLQLSLPPGHPVMATFIVLERQRRGAKRPDRNGSVTTFTLWLGCGYCGCARNLTRRVTIEKGAVQEVSRKEECARVAGRSLYRRSTSAHRDVGESSLISLLLVERWCFPTQRESPPSISPERERLPGTPTIPLPGAVHRPKSWLAHVHAPRAAHAARRHQENFTCSTRGGPRRLSPPPRPLPPPHLSSRWKPHAPRPTHLHPLGELGR